MLTKRRRRKLRSLARSPIDEALDLVRNPAVSDARRVAVARSLIRQGHHAGACLAVLDEIRRKPDRSLTRTGRDSVLRALTRATPPAVTPKRSAGPPPYWPDGPHGRAMRAEHGGTCLPLEEYRELTDEECGYPISRATNGDDD